MRATCLALLAAALATTACGKGAAGPWNTYPGLAGHAGYFQLVGTPHDPSAPGTIVTCAGCHPATTPSGSPGSFADYDCTTCHGLPTQDYGSAGKGQAGLTAFHAGVSGFQWLSSACYGCHKSGLGVPADHSTRYFPIGTVSHPAVCASCHTVPASPGDPQATTLANLACATCHRARAAPSDLATLHAKVSTADLQPATATSARCLLCHADDATQSVAAHQQKFPIALNSGTHGTACLECHTAQRGDKVYPAADFTAYDCLACHTNAGPSGNVLATTDAQHTGLTGYAYASGSCYGCHPDGTGAPANHTPNFFPIGAGTAHATVSCTQCHTNLASPNNPANFACATCHSSPTGPTPTLITDHTTNTSNTRVKVPASELSTTDSTTCLRCHADSQVSLTSSHPSGATGDPPHQGAVCLQCHDVYRTDKPYGIDFATDPSAAAKCGPVLSSCSVKKGCYECHNSSPPRGN
jgi:hypothetical protein